MRRAYTKLLTVVDSFGIMSGFSFLVSHISLHSEFLPMGVYYSCTEKKKKVLKGTPRTHSSDNLVYLIICLANFLFNIVRLAGTHKFHSCDGLD